MRILVTGAAGFVGSHLCEKLAILGYDVIGIDSFTNYYDRKLKERNAEDVRRAGAHFVEADLCTDHLARFVEHADVIYHLAAQPGISAQVPMAAYIRNNLMATHQLLEAAKTSPTLRLFVHTSTSSVYGKRATDPEDVAPQPISYYGVTKLAGEQLAMAYHREYNFPTTVLRLFSVYGPRERPEKLYPRLMESITSGKPFPFYEGAEHHKRTYTYVEDALDAYCAVLNRREAVLGEIFNIGSNNCRTTGEGIRIVEDIFGKKAPMIRVPKRPGDQQYTDANIEKARRILGYEPKTQPEIGLRKTVEWYLSTRP